MAVKTDDYIVSLAEIIQRVENAYALTEATPSGVKYLDLDIADIIKYVSANCTSLNRELITKRNIDAGRSIAILPYVSARLTFFDKKRLDFSHYPGMQKVAGVLLDFTSASRITEGSLASVNKIVEVLSAIDAKHVNYRGGLGYRYLRIFTIMVLYGNFCNAAVVADFLLKQFVTKGA